MIALYLVQRGLHRAAMLLATLFGVTAILVFVSLLPALFSLPTLGEGYATASSYAQRAAYLATGRFALTQIMSGLVVLVFLLAVWTLITSAVMRKGVFGRTLNYLGIVSGLGSAGVGINLVLPTPLDSLALWSGV